MMQGEASEEVASITEHKGPWETEVVEFEGTYMTMAQFLEEWAKRPESCFTPVDDTVAAAASGSSLGSITSLLGQFAKTAVLVGGMAALTPLAVALAATGAATALTVGAAAVVLEGGHLAAKAATAIGSAVVGVGSQAVVAVAATAITSAVAGEEESEAAALGTADTACSSLAAQVAAAAKRGIHTAVGLALLPATATVATINAGARVATLVASTALAVVGSAVKAVGAVASAVIRAAVAAGALVARVAVKAVVGAAGLLYGACAGFALVLV